MHIVVLTGAGISAESGLQTFRGMNGLWEGYRIEDVATPAAWAKNPALVQKFYNIRRKDCINASPNKAHLALVELEKFADVTIITQNIDDLHERAGSKNILHLHGQIRKSQSTVNPKLVYDIKGDEIRMGETCALGSQLRPHVVWFGEDVPNMSKAIDIVHTADHLVVIGTSLQVYPAANLIYEINNTCEITLIDPNPVKIKHTHKINIIEGSAVDILPNWVNQLAK